MNNRFHHPVLVCVMAVILFLGTSIPAHSQSAPPDIRPLSLSQAITLALQNSSNFRLSQAGIARAEAERQQIAALFRPQVFTGTGLAATKGFPLSIEGSAPSIFQLSTNQSLFDRNLSNLEKQAGKMRDAASQSLEEKRDEIATVTASVYLDLDRSRRSMAFFQSQAQALSAIEEMLRQRVEEGLEPPLESARAALETARINSNVVMLENRIAQLDFQLRDLAGITEPVSIETQAVNIPPLEPEQSPDRLYALARERHPGLAALEEEVRAREFQVRSEQGTRWPRVNLVGQYGLFSDINNFSDYFRRFERHNATFGISVMVPVYERERYSARLSKAEADLEDARARLEETRSALSRRAHELWAQLRQQDAALEVARLELTVAQESLDATQALYEEGKVSRLALQQDAAAETRFHIALLDAEFQSSQSRIELLRLTGQIRTTLP